MAKSEYQKKLLDPRWQKKRLEILNRDDFTCQICCDTESTLHIHHRYYKGEPWEAPNTALVTLCEVCHAEETSGLKKSQKLLMEALADICVDSEGFHELARVFYIANQNGIKIHERSLYSFVHMLERLFTQDGAWQEMIDTYFEMLANRRKSA